MSPKLQGDAGEFVFGELPKRIRSNYPELIAELENRFRKIETPKFSNRIQKNGESTEDYAAELKKLYSKAYPNRPGRTRHEDLVRRFLNGLTDDKACFHVEYIKDPQDIDEAVYKVVNFIEVNKRKAFTDVNKEKSYKPARTVKIPDENPISVPGDEEVHIARIPERSQKPNFVKSSLQK